MDCFALHMGPTEQQRFSELDGRGNFTQEKFAILMAKANAFNYSTNYAGNSVILSEELNNLWSSNWNAAFV